MKIVFVIKWYSLYILFVWRIGWVNNSILIFEDVLVSLFYWLGVSGLRVDLLILKFVVDLLKLVYWYLVVMVW